MTEHGPSIVIMRTDDNGNDFEVMRVETRAEAEVLVRTYEARAHKQTYWIAEATGRPARSCSRG